LLSSRENSVFRSVDDFEQTRRAHAATDAHGHHVIFRFCAAGPRSRDGR
jgi:hypothetical protein